MQREIKLNKENKMSFEQKTNKLQKLMKSGWNYMYSLKTPRYSNGFWNRYGYKVEELLEDLKTNHAQQWVAWCNETDSEGRIRMCDEVSVEELFC